MTKEIYQKMISQDVGRTLCEINDKYNTSYQGEFCCFGLTNILDKIFNWCNIQTSCTTFYNMLIDKYQYEKIPFISTSIGDFVFYDWDNSGDCDHIGIVYDIKRDNNNQKILQVLEYNRSGTGTSWKNNKVGYREISIIDATNYHCKFVKTDILEDDDELENNSDDTNDDDWILHNAVSSMMLIQLCLKSMGLYNGNCDGIAGEKTHTAVTELSKIIKANI